MGWETLDTNCELAKVRYQLACEMKAGKDPLQGKTIQECLDEMPEETFHLKREPNDLITI